jgi:hypothetical protein
MESDEGSEDKDWREADTLPPTGLVKVLPTLRDALFF